MIHEALTEASVRVEGTVVLYLHAGGGRRLSASLLGSIGSATQVWRRQVMTMGDEACHSLAPGNEP